MLVKSKKSAEKKGKEASKLTTSKSLANLKPKAKSKDAPLPKPPGSGQEYSLLKQPASRQPAVQEWQSELVQPHIPYSSQHTGALPTWHARSQSHQAANPATSMLSKPPDYAQATLTHQASLHDRWSISTTFVAPDTGAFGAQTGQALDTGWHGGSREEGAQFDRMARDMDATIASIDALNSSEEQARKGIMQALQNEAEPNIKAQQMPRSGQPGSFLTENYFSKVWLYANARLPPHLPPFKVYMPTYPLLCLAAQYSLVSYSKSVPPRLMTTIPASMRTGTKASLILLHPNDTSNTIVLAIRGTHSFTDWAVNLSSSPAPPTGFLDDPGNLVHGGFLAVAKSMLHPIAERLRSVIADTPARRNASLLLTGHSAGGAVAALLYAHLAAPDGSGVQSELRELRGFLGRIHCITFGSPPVSLLPLERPSRRDGRLQYSEEYSHAWRKSLFFSFINEGDPVARAGDTSYVRSLLSLYAASAPLPTAHARPVTWQVPPTTYSNPGRLVLLRGKSAPVAAAEPKPAPKLKSKLSLAAMGKVGKKVEKNATALSDGQDVLAFLTSDEQLRGVVFGDPATHAMRLYAARIERLAVGAVTAGVYDS